METIIQIGGVYNIAFVIFHITFWWLFNWKSELALLNPINRAIMQVLNLSLTACFLIFAYISLWHANELLLTRLGRALLLFMAIFWLLRAIEQIIFFGVKRGLSIGFFVTFCVGGLLYLYPWVVALNLSFSQ